MPVTIDRAIQVTLRMQLFNQTVENVLIYHYASSDVRPSNSDLAVFAQAFYTGVQSAYRAFTSSQLHFLEVIARDLSPTNPTEGAYTIPPNINGGLTLETMPNQIAAVLSLKTGERSRRGRGRVYTVGFVTAQISLGVITNTTLVSLAALGVAFFNVFGTTDLHTSLAVGSRVSHVTFIVTSITVDAVFDTMRSRVIGVGD